MIYFTADLHLGHRNIIKHADRPFDSVEEMNETLINNINSFVTNNDTLYLLGDIAFIIEKEEANELIKRINGKKIFIKGNHDRHYDESLFEEICDYKEIKYNKTKFILMHYPLRSWNHMRSGSIQLHGHIHAPRQYNLNNRGKGIYQYDVGVDANDYCPVSIDQIIEFFKDVPIVDFANKYSELED